MNEYFGDLISISIFCQ